MKLFKPKNEKIVDDFKRPLPYWGYTPVEYEDYKPLEELKEYLDAMIKKLASTDIDSGNANVLDETIHSRVEAAIKDLTRQRIRHKEWIHNKCTQREGTKIRFENALNRARQELERISPEVDELRAKYISYEQHGGYRNVK